MDKDFYNKSSSDSLGWDPSWFGCEEFNVDLVKAVQKWQKANGLTADGLVGPMTYRRIWTEREVNISDYEPKKNVILQVISTLFIMVISFQSNGKKLFYGTTTMGSKQTRVVILTTLENLIENPPCL